MADTAAFGFRLLRGDRILTQQRLISTVDPTLPRTVLTPMQRNAEETRGPKLGHYPRLEKIATHTRILYTSGVEYPFPPVGIVGAADGKNRRAFFCLFTE